MAEIHETQSGAGSESPSSSWFFDSIVKQLPATVLMLALAAGGWWLTSRDTSAEHGRKLELLEKRAEINAQNIAQNSSVLQQNAIRIAELSLVQQRLVDELKELKEELRRLRPQQP